MTATVEQLRSPLVRITVSVQEGERILQYIAEGNDYDDCVAALRKLAPTLFTHAVRIVGEAK